jgi:hypothetical protein
LHNKKTLFFHVHHGKKIVILEGPKRGWLEVHLIPKKRNNHGNKGQLICLDTIKIQVKKTIKYNKLKAIYSLPIPIIHGSQLIWV